ncbi:MAG TPA: hypothetical protein VGU19_02375 [Microvirga sp.]|nr:hypothetical protein [Microvirga sp.]
MSALSWIRRISLRSLLPKQGYIRAAAVGPVLAHIMRREGSRIVVRPVPGGFAASLRSLRSKGELQAWWQEDDRRWRPESSSHRLLHAARHRSVDLELPPDLTLTQRVKLPEAARTNLSEAIAYGLPTWSPFEIDEVYVKGSVDEVQAGQARIRLIYALRTKVDPLLARLEEAGLPADRLVLDATSGPLVTLATPKLARLRRARRVDGALAIMAVSLGLLLGSLRVMVLAQRLEESEILLRTEIAQFRQEEALRATYAAFVARRAAVSERRAKEVGAYELLVALAEHLPDEALVQTLEIGSGRGRIDLAGSGPDVAIEALRQIPVLRNLRIEPSRELGSVTAGFEISGKGQ